ncbi:MAG: glycosyltransferase family 2 protein [Aliishimia sp.]
MANSTAKWGIVTTVLSPKADILRFCAYHLRAGAHRIYIYLDDPDADVFDALKAHRRIRPTRCTTGYWKQQGGARPLKHQVRQTKNATRTYHRKSEVDWLIHIDVDEFLVSKAPIAEVLSDIDTKAQCARIRPMEVLAGDPTLFKAHIPNTADRDAILDRVYPTYGTSVKGGFLSHVAGKLFVRLGQDGLKLRIHNAFVEQLQNPNQIDLPQIDLAHLHAKSWDDWLAHFRYRLEKGSYREELGTNRPRSSGGITMHELLCQIEAEGGEKSLRQFYDEMCAATPELVARLTSEGLLKRADLQLDAALHAEFPGMI